MRKYPATLVEVFETKLAEGHADDEIPFGKADLTRATEALDISVRDVMEIPSAYASQPGVARRDCRSRLHHRTGHGLYRST